MGASNERDRSAPGGGTAQHYKNRQRPAQLCMRHGWLVDLTALIKTLVALLPPHQVQNSHFRSSLHREAQASSLAARKSRCSALRPLIDWFITSLMARRHVAWHGMAWHGMAWLGLAWHGMA